ncbi:MAG: hypothetical protein N4A47_03485 [Clostridia bacterium]|jgi:drug/metabolite transporter superfamily protein YnfA|nr:hypothetical protein [Clostridia bacterium]
MREFIYGLGIVKLFITINPGMFRTNDVFFKEIIRFFNVYGGIFIILSIVLLYSDLKKKPKNTKGTKKSSSTMVKKIMLVLFLTAIVTMAMIAMKDASLLKTLIK